VLYPGEMSTTVRTPACGVGIGQQLMPSNGLPSELRSCSAVLCPANLNGDRADHQRWQQKQKARSGLRGGGRAPPPPITSNPPGSFNICSSLPGGENPDPKDWQSCRSPCYLGVGFVGCQSFGTGPHFVFPRSPRGGWEFEVPHLEASGR